MTAITLSFFRPHPLDKRKTAPFFFPVRSPFSFHQDHRCEISPPSLKFSQGAIYRRLFFFFFLEDLYGFRSRQGRLIGCSLFLVVVCEWQYFLPPVFREVFLRGVNTPRYRRKKEGKTSLTIAYF